MSRVGADWYKREPVAYLGDTQGLSSREHAVYSVVIELLYIHGGTIRNDPGWIAGWISDMGQAMVRKTLAQLASNPHITLTITEDEISQKRAKNQAKTKEKLRENREKTGRKGGEKSAEIRAALRENKDLAEPSASNAIQAEKIREDKSKEREANASQKKVDFSEQKDGQPKDLFEDQTEAKKPKPKTATRLPPDWTLPPELAEWARSKGISSTKIAFEAEKFRDFWIAKSGKDATKTDWPATWRNWMRKFIDPGQPATADPYAHYGRRPAPTREDIDRWDRMGRGHERQGAN